MFTRVTAIVVGFVCWAVPALADINLEYRPPSQTVAPGDTVNIGLYAVSDDETDQLLMSTQVIIAWDPSFLQLLGLDDTGAVPLQLSSFPANDPFGLNEVVPPQDGVGLYVALGPLGDPVAATPDGTLLTTFQFLALPDATPGTAVDILESAGDPVGHTIVYDGTIPNLDVTGTLTGATVVIFGPIRVPMDIKPTACPNPFNPASHGSFPMALVGSLDFDVTMVDLGSLLLSRADGVGGSVAPRRPRRKDVATPFLGEPCDCHQFGSDDIMDLQMKFNTRTMVDVLELGPIVPGASVLLILTGHLEDGTEFFGMDCIRRTPSFGGGP